MAGLQNYYKLSRLLTNYLYLLPIIAVVLFLFLYPVAFAVYISFTNFDLYHLFTYTVIGFRIYEQILTSSTFYTLLLNTVIWTVGSLVPMVLVGFVLALILNQRDIRGRNVFFTLFLIPWAFPAYISLVIWSGMWNYKYGIINKFLGLLGIPQINWLNTIPPAWFALILTNLWLSFPYYTAVFLSSLQSIPGELYDIATVDGASAWQKFTSITMPMMRSAIAFVSVGGFVFTWNNFYPIYILTGGGPGIATNILIVYMYQEAFSYGYYNIAAAYSVISTIILIIMALIMLRVGRVLEVIT
ncbi:carbohydrate ABC transporter permease [Vulcanisaeta thermophila]|uniref:carbohydrate ABC transporter permease n=1 Tax=Vulcanisaeta thermophila TaxID=867917 RepID=UPI000853C8B0|nr:sugar ABC transporter permease [Vulcanisaeta thermophila]